MHLYHAVIYPIIC